jgi:KipI family sensor histidine kinase inhibitor
MFKIFPSGDSAIIVKVGDDISVETNQIVRRLLARIEQERIKGIIDYIPSYNELLICYDPFVCSYNKLVEIIKGFETELEMVDLPASSMIIVPVVYGGEFGPDLKDVAEYNNLIVEEVIKIHSSPTYLVYMLGFTPGFCYLGGMDKRIAMPRKQNPRLKIPEGAVGIADQQTGIYPIVSPGGWQLIGQTPLRLFDLTRTSDNQFEQGEAFLFNMGDTLRFVPISESEFYIIRSEISEGTYQLKRL